MENFSSVDVFVALVVGLSAILSMNRGFASEMLGIGSWFLASLAGFYAMPYLGPYVERYVSKPLLANIISIVIAALAALIILTVICSRITLKVRKSVLNRLDHFLGLIFGLLRGVVLLVLLYFIGMALAPKTLDDMREDSRTMPYLETVTEHVKDQLPESLFDNPPEEESSEDIGGLIQKLNKPAPKAKSKKKSKLAEEIKSLPKDDPLRVSLEELANETPQEPPKEEKELFEMLNSPTVTEKKAAGEGYNQKEREELDRLFLENWDDVESVIP